VRRGPPGNRWVDIGAEDYTDVAIEEVSEALGIHVDAESVAWQVAPEQLDQNNIRMHAEFSASSATRPSPSRWRSLSRSPARPVRAVEDRRRVVRLHRAGPRCRPDARQRGDQPGQSDRPRGRRGDGGDGDRDAFVTEINEGSEGPNIKVSTNKIGMKVSRRIVDELGGSFSDSERLITEDEDGNEVYRVSYAVRLPKYAPARSSTPKTATARCW